MTAPQEPSAPATAPLRIPAFRRLFIAAFFFHVGQLIQVVASSWVVLELTGSALWVSLAVGAPLLPLLLLSLPAGAAADLFDRRRVLIASSSVMVLAGIALLSMWIAGAVTAGRLVAAGVAFGVGVAFFNPAWNATIPSLIPVGLLPGAVSLSSASSGAATAIGPAIGGVLVATVGPGWAFGSAAVGSVVILAAVARTDVSRYGQDHGSILTGIATGLRYVRFSSDYRWLLLVGCLFGIGSSALGALLPTVTSELLRGGSALYGTLLACAGVGALVGGLTRQRGSRLLGQRMVTGSIVLFGGSLGLVGISRAAYVTAAAVLAAGLFSSWILATLIGTVQVLTPNWVRGRTMSVVVLTMFGLAPIGAVAAGTLADVVGVQTSLMAAGAALAILGILAARLPLPLLEHVEPPVMADLPISDDAWSDEPHPVTVINSWHVELDKLDEFQAVLDELRRVRLRTGAYQWGAYRSRDDTRRVFEISTYRSWNDLVRTQRRLDTRSLQLVRWAWQFGGEEQARETEYLIRWDNSKPTPRNR